MSVAERAPATHHNIALSSVDVGNAAAICFQSAGQVVTVLGKLDRHFYDNTDLADFTKRAVADYAAKRETQIVTVVVIKDSAAITHADATTQVSVDGQHYAITIGDLRDGRTQMDHINRIIERLKYLQAVMVMLSTTDMLGTSQAVGKQMGGLNAKVQQVQRLGMKLEQFSKLVAQAQQEGKPLPAEALKPIASQLNRLNTSANPPEIRKIVQTMLTQVKELRQLPVMRQVVVQTAQANVNTNPIRVAARNDAPVKTETRFKIPLKLVASKDTPQQPRIPTAASELTQVARHVPAPVGERASIAPTTQQRFSVVTDSVKQAPVLITLAQGISAVSAPIMALPQSNAQISNIAAVVQPVVHVPNTVRQTAPVQAATVQHATVRAPHIVASNNTTVVPSVQTTPVEQQINNQPVEAKASTAQPNTSGVPINPVAEVQPQRTQETQRSVETARNSTHSEPQRNGIVPDGTTARTEPSQPVQPVSRLGGTQNGGISERIGTPNPDNENPTLRDPQSRHAPADKAKPFGAEGRSESSTHETARLRTGDRNSRPQHPSTQEGDNKKPAKTITSIVQEFKDCGCGHCADKAKALSGTRNAPAGTIQATGGVASQGTSKANPKTNITAEFRPACEGLCLCADKAQKEVTAKETPTGEREFGRRTRRASAPQANAA